MTKKPSGYYRPKNLYEALDLLLKPDTSPLGGGTKLLANDVEGAVVDLQDLGLDRIEIQDGWMHIGATAALNSAVHGVDEDLFSNRAETKLDQEGLLQRSLLLAGPNTYRNSATFGGTSASRLQDSELLAALLVFDAEMTVYNPKESKLNLEEYLAAEENATGLITQISFPWIVGFGSSHRVARTPADYPIVSVTGWLPKGGNVRLAATGLYSRPTRLIKSEEVLSAGISDETIEAAAEEAKHSCTHPGDFRGSQEYRSSMAEVLTRRVLRDIRELIG